MLTNLLVQNLLCCLFCLHLLCVILWLLKESAQVAIRGAKSLFFFRPAGNLGIMSNPLERLRQLVGSNTWDYCVLWRLSEDHRFLEFMDCCCAGSERHIENGNAGEEFLFSCRDVLFQHPRMTTCELLTQLPSSHPLDGINMETLISNQPRWLNFSNVSDLSPNEMAVHTKVLIPIPGGLAELFAAKQVNEDQSVVDYVVTQCTTLMEQEAMSSSGTTGPSFTTNNGMIHELQQTSLSDLNNSNQILRDQFININESQTAFSPANTHVDNLNLANCDPTAVDQINLSNSSTSFMQQYNYMPDNSKTRSNFQEASNDSFPVDHHQQQQLNTFNSMTENGFEDLMNNTGNMHNSKLHVLDHSVNLEQQQLADEKGSLPKHEMGRADSVSDSDHLDEDDDPKCRRRATNKGPQSKNLMAERKRRKKLNERLYNLRSLVPNISKLDRASILGDAIKYVQELQKEADDLQNELERNSDDEDADYANRPDHHHPLHQSAFTPESSNVIRTRFGGDYDHEKPANGYQHMGASESSKISHDFDGVNDKGQQMEVQVEVAQLEGNDFFIKVFGEQMKGGFVRLMEALSCLGLEITNVNMTSCISLVSYVFTVKKRDSEIVQADYLRDSLLEATRSQAGFWSEMAQASENGNGIDHHHQLQQQTHHLQNHNLGPFHGHFHHL